MGGISTTFCVKKLYYKGKNYGLRYEVTIVFPEGIIGYFYIRKLLHLMGMDILGIH